MKSEHTIINMLVKAMKEAQDNGSVDHLDCAEDGGESWYTAIKAGELYLDGVVNIDAALKEYEEEYWPKPTVAEVLEDERRRALRKLSPRERIALGF